jgi:hypothetical protein
MSLTTYTQEETEDVTAMTEMLNPPTQLVTELKAREESELRDLLDRVGVKIEVAITKEQLEQLNRLWWAIWFTLKEKDHAGTSERSN